MSKKSFNDYFRRSGQRVQVHFPDPSLTEQSHKSTCDIRRIVKTASASGGVLGHVSPRQATYGDFLGSPGSFHEAMNIVAAANSRFNSLPSRVREFFKNSPANFVDFCSDPENRDEMVKLGLDVSHLPDPASDLASPPASKAPADDSALADQS